ncbi:major facilitator superfamily domain-containing protein [Aspergillus insuetus]
MAEIRHGKAKSAQDETILPSSIPFWRLVVNQNKITDEVLHQPYAGSGTENDPYAVTWPPSDPLNPMNFRPVIKWFITILVSFITLAVALVSSAFSGGMAQIAREFAVEEEIVILGVSLFVLGFAIGPLIWAPLSEVFGRRRMFTVSFVLLTAFNAGTASAQNTQTLIILRFLSGCFGSSPFGNAGGTIADMFPASQRGLAISMFAAAPFLGPTVGPIIGGFLATGCGWRWVEGFLAIFTGVLALSLVLFLPETYSPVLLRRRAAQLSKITSHVYRSKLDIDKGPVALTKTLRTALSRPWILLFCEPIVLFSSIYMPIIYGTLYMLFAAYPIVFQQVRGWSEGIGGLAFLGILVGMILAIMCRQTSTGRLPPEARLPLSMVGGLALPIGLFWFAWTNSPSIHWMTSIAAGAPFGLGMVLIFLSVSNYLIDSYTIFAASVLAANSALRSLFGMAFPLFTTYMYRNLGIHWASSIPAFLSLLCAPLPFMFYRYGGQIRQRCTFAAEADAFMRRLDCQGATRERVEENTEDSTDSRAA